MQKERRTLPQRLMWPDLVVEREEGLHLLGQRRRVLDLALADMAARARAAVMIDAAGAMPTWSTIADILPTRLVVTAHHRGTASPLAPDADVLPT